MTEREVNFDGLVGPTHNYAGLSQGNLASQSHAQLTSHPQKAALQGLLKMKRLMDLGFTQAVLPPQKRPHWPSLALLGFKGAPKKVLAELLNQDPRLLNIFSSASNMWAANAATVCPSVDSSDGKIHFVPSNLVAQPHRSIEAKETQRVFEMIFSDPNHFKVHPPLPAHPYFGDEGAANHTRFSTSFNQAGLHLWVYGRSALNPHSLPKLYTARQTQEASEAIARLFNSPKAHSLMLAQNPKAIDAGVFHNDVISVGHLNTFFCHEEAFLDPLALVHFKNAFESLFKESPEIILVPKEAITLQDAVSSYLFNSQLLGDKSNKWILAPLECQENPRVEAYLKNLIGSQSTSIKHIEYFDLRESMQNGGGPACLRLRVVMNDKEISKMHAGVLLTPALYETLKAIILKYYPAEINPEDLFDEKLHELCATAFDHLSQAFNLKGLYD